MVIYFSLEQGFSPMGDGQNKLLSFAFDPWLCFAFKEVEINSDADLLMCRDFFEVVKLYCLGFETNEICLQLHLLAYKLGNFLGWLALLVYIKYCSQLLKTKNSLLCRGMMPSYLMKSNSPKAIRPFAPVQQRMSPSFRERGFGSGGFFGQI